MYYLDLDNYRIIETNDDGTVTDLTHYSNLNSIEDLREKIDAFFFHDVFGEDVRERLMGIIDDKLEDEDELLGYTLKTRTGKILVSNSPKYQVLSAIKDHPAPDVLNVLFEDRSTNSNVKKVSGDDFLIQN